MLNLLRLATLAAALAWTAGAQAQAFSSKPIKWIVPYTPGGITDNVTRVVTQRVQEQTGWNILVENKPGANSILGADLAAKSPPDGYTFLTVIAAHAANATLYAGAPEVPTMAEAGGPALEASTWVLFLAPAGTPQEIVNRMSAEVAKAVAAGDIKGRFEAIGIEPVGNTARQAGKFLDDEIAKWSKVIKAAGVKVEP